MHDQSSDPKVQALRERITANDVELIARVNERLRLVGELHDYKVAQGYDLKDAGREARLFETLQAANPGPLAEDALVALMREVLALTLLETGRIRTERAGR